MPIIDPVPVTTHSPYGPDTNVVPALVNDPVIFEAPIELSETPGDAQLYIAISNADPNYGGSNVYLSTDSGLSYRLIGATVGNAITGVLAGNWSTSTDPDVTNDLLLDLTESLGDLLSYDALDRDAFQFPGYVETGPVGDGITPPIPFELISWKTATMTGANLYTIDATDTIRRGVFGAPLPNEGVAHTTGDRFAFVDPSGIGIFRMTLSGLIGVPLKFKFAAMNQFQSGLQSITDCTEYSFTPTGATMAHEQGNYIQTPAANLSQASLSFDITVDQVDVEFPERTVRYNARAITVPDPGIGLTAVYYVTIEDRNHFGDSGAGTDLSAFAETTLDRVGVLGYTYLGSIEVTHVGGATTVTSGGGLAASALRNV